MGDLGLIFSLCKELILVGGKIFLIARRMSERLLNKSQFSDKTDGDEGSDTSVPDTKMMRTSRPDKVSYVNEQGIWVGHLGTTNCLL